MAATDEKALEEQKTHWDKTADIDPLDTTDRDPHDDADSCCGHDDDADEQDSKSFLLPMTAWLAIAGVGALGGLLVHLLLATPAAQTVATILSLLGLAAGLVILLPELAEAVRERRINISVLLVIAAIGACLLQEFAEAGVVVFLFCIGEALEQLALRRSRSSVAELLDLAPPLVHLKGPDGSVSEVSPESVPSGSTLVIRPGERLALDAVVLAGSAQFDESPVTGESLPRLKQAGDPLYAGTLNLDGRLECVTTSTVQDSTLASMVRLVEAAQRARTPYERFINRFARIYTPGVVIAAACIAFLPPLLGLIGMAVGGGFADWAYRALSLLVIACPCALVIAAPVAVVNGISHAAKNGVLVKGGAYLEIAAKVKVLALDKTGTLTTGRPQLEEVYLLPAATRLWGGQAPTRALALAALLEEDSNHPLAKAIQAAQVERPATPTPGLAAPGFAAPSHLVEQAGRGIQAMVSDELAAIGSAAYIGQLAAIGSAAYIGELATIDGQAEAAVGRFEARGATALLLSYGGQALAVLGIRDSLRPESPGLIHKLHTPGLAARGSQSMQTVMLSGDNPRAARQIAAEAGVQSFHAELLPAQKMAVVQELKAHGKVAFVGDGINDALALTEADVGIAMGAAGSDIALEVADVALMADNIGELPFFFSLSRQVMRTVYTSVAFTLLVKAVVMVLAIMGISQMWMAIAADVGVLLLVLLYSMRPGIGRRARAA